MLLKANKKYLYKYLLKTCRCCCPSYCMQRYELNWKKKNSISDERTSTKSGLFIVTPIYFYSFSETLSCLLCAGADDRFIVGAKEVIMERETTLIAQREREKEKDNCFCTARQDISVSFLNCHTFKTQNTEKSKRERRCWLACLRLSAMKHDHYRIL